MRSVLLIAKTPGYQIIIVMKLVMLPNVDMTQEIVGSIILPKISTKFLSTLILRLRIGILRYLMEKL